ncbi:transposase [Mesorhizobium sp. M0923]|uniref:transposase n=1 Tax=Mesorhizobium sp. M0923 TaxID=2957028 RepID=UPI0033380FED
MMFKIMVLQALYGPSDDQAEFLIQDRLSFMRFLGLGLGDRGPDACAQSRQHRFDSLGRHGLSLEKERGSGWRRTAPSLISTTKIEGSADERSDVADQRPTLQNPYLCRARLRAAEIPGTIGTARARTKIGRRISLQSHPLRMASGVNCASTTVKTAQTAVAMPKSANRINLNNQIRRDRRH